jgi:hypothetical protein
MNILLDSLSFNIHNVFFLDKKKNTVIDGSFTKLLYSTKYFTMNGLYFTIPFLVKTKKQCYKISKCVLDEAVEKRVTTPENKSNQVQDNYTMELNTALKHKNNCKKTIKELVSIGTTSNKDDYNNFQNTNIDEKHILHILQNNSYDNSMSYKSIVHFYPHDVINLQYITCLSEIETAILTLYKSINDINKTNKLSLASQLYSGCFKIYNEHNANYNMNTYYLKISGVWENNNEIGITYKVIKTIL